MQRGPNNVQEILSFLVFFLTAEGFDAHETVFEGILWKLNQLRHPESGCSPPHFGLWQQRVNTANLDQPTILNICFYYYTFSVWNISTLTYKKIVQPLW